MKGVYDRAKLLTLKTRKQKKKEVAELPQFPLRTNPQDLPLGPLKGSKTSQLHHTGDHDFNI
jgi:hypothetical protein